MQEQPKMIKRNCNWSGRRSFSCYFLHNLYSGEFSRKGDKGCLEESTSLKSSFPSTGLLILGLDFLLLPCEHQLKVKQNLSYGRNTERKQKTRLKETRISLPCRKKVFHQNQVCVSLSGTALSAFYWPHPKHCFDQTIRSPKITKLPIFSQFTRPDRRSNTFFLFKSTHLVFCFMEVCPQMFLVFLQSIDLSNQSNNLLC